jgi:hypothetical protein
MSPCGTKCLPMDTIFDRTGNLQRRCPSVYFGGCSSLLIQPIAFSVFIGSGESQSKHWNVRCPLPPGNASAIGLEHFGHNRYALLMVAFTRSGTRLQSRHQVGPLTTSCEWHIGSRRLVPETRRLRQESNAGFHWLMLEPLRPEPRASTSEAVARS